MKKTLRLIGIAVIAILFTATLSACSDDDDDDDFNPIGFDQQDPDLVGIWEYTYTQGNKTETETIEFYANGTYSETDVESRGTTTSTEWEKGTWNTNAQKTQVKFVITDSDDRKDIGNVDVENYRVSHGTLVLDGKTYMPK